MTPREDHAEWGSAKTGCVEEATPTTIMTTFYDLIAATHAVVEPDAADLQPSPPDYADYVYA